MTTISTRGQRLERIPQAADRMGVSPSQVYREIKKGRLGPLVKLGIRASAIPTDAVNSWIENRIVEAGGNAVEQLTTLTLPTLNEGETYAGLILKEDGTPSHHLILLPGDNDEATWEEQKEWAKSIGGELPTRQEQPLLRANCKQHFKNDYYWSGEEHATESGWAWYQNFFTGSQLIIHKGTALRARAVRRLPIQ